ncbi:MAG TPA: RluA family pseudouridine synthase [Polyangiaceae bacterium]|nr:RluA family pseudouridine synthase [Polyangiaceae bacterium]
MAQKTITIDDTYAGMRLDKVVALSLGLGRGPVRRLFEEGRVRVGRRPGVKGDVLPAGATVEVSLPEVEGEAALAEAAPARPLVVLVETPEAVVVDKPAGQPSAPLRPGETGALANALVGRYPEMAGVGFHPREPGLVHRLDTGTSGVLVAARSAAAFEALSAGLKAGRLAKDYLAVCQDDELPETGHVDIPLAPHPKDSRRVLACLHPRDVARLEPRPASTEYRVERRAGGRALVRVRAPRALRHQIRAHLAAIGCPIVGDELYGAEPVPGLGRHALHATFVGWRGGDGVSPFEARSPLPAELEALLA